MSLVIESIYSVLVSRLDAIESTTVNDIDIEEIEEPLTDGEESPRNGQVVIGWGSCERVEDLDAPGNPPGIAWRQVFNLDIHVRDELSTTPSRQITQRYVDAVKAAVLSASDSYSMGGNAIDSEFLPWDYKETQGQLGGAMLPLAVTYRVSEYSGAVQR